MSELIYPFGTVTKQTKPVRTDNRQQNEMTHQVTKTNRMNEPKLIIIENMTNYPTISLSTVIKLTIWIREGNLNKVTMV